MKKIVLMSLVASSILMAGGYKIPETSTNAVALGAANIAHNQNNADAAYYNPAKMVYMSDENHIEIDAMYVGLDSVNYQGTVAGGGPYNTNSEKEDFLIPSLHYVSSALGDKGVRVGLSITAPAGLSKQWKTQPGASFAEEFSLEIIEINPTAAFKVTDNFSVAVGVRLVSSSGVAKATPVPGVIFQDMTGDSIDFGYNLALAYNPMPDLELGLTYRSKVDMALDGDALLAYPGNGTTIPALPAASYAGGVTLPLPAVLSIAAAYTFPTKTTLEFVYERTYWSSYKSLDFNYDNLLAEAIFGTPKAKDWKDTNTFRLGLTQELQDMTIMAGFVMDQAAVPDGTIGFELPDTDSMALSLGGRYKINDKLDFALSGLYSMHESRSVNNGLLNGEFSDGDVLIVSAGLGYKF